MLPSNCEPQEVTRGRWRRAGAPRHSGKLLVLVLKFREPAAALLAVAAERVGDDGESLG